MSQHASEACNEGNGLWLPITEYSVKSGVSLSTIRRKIKTNSIQYRLEKGKYFILFSEVNNAAVQQPSLHSSVAPVYQEPVRRAEVSFFRPQSIPPTPPPAPAMVPKMEEEEETIRMVSEAYEHKLNEKEERIRLLEKRNGELEERLIELRLLVRVLEEKYQVRY